MSFKVVDSFEKEVAKYFGAPFGIAVDCCTHGLELALRYTGATRINVPTRTYLSVPMLANKLGIGRMWRTDNWEDYYTIAPKVIDAAVLWKEFSYISGSFMVLSFQFKKHLNLGRGGMILTDDYSAYVELKKMSYDGRTPEDTPWIEQNISSIGYHYYMTPETASLGLKKLEAAKKATPKKWTSADYPDLLKFDIFKNG